MSTLVLLDAGPLGLVTNPRATPENQQCKQWLMALTTAGIRVLVPEITDYEVRRELLRADKRRGITRLDQLKASAGYLPLTTATMLQAAELWAQARRQGLPTADPKELDADTILAAQAMLLRRPGDTVVVATTNVGRLQRFITADLWQKLTVAALQP
jgi:predicted nucleic acid-binding protein